VGKKRILVVDEPALGTEVATFLDGAGYEVITANDGHQGIYEAIVRRPDLVILGDLMPEMDGWTTSEHLLSHELTARIPIIFMSAQSTKNQRLDGWFRGCFGHVSKPFRPDELLGQIQLAFS
jgi:DNA-binding response OmpR family regulator